MTRYIKTSKLREIINREIEEVIQLEKQIGSTLKSIQEFDISPSNEDVRDALTFYIKEFRLNSLLEAYNHFCNDAEMREIKKESDRRYEVYFNDILKYFPKGRQIGVVK